MPINLCFMYFINEFKDISTLCMNDALVWFRKDLNYFQKQIK